jgi:hypothetical protein
MLRPDPGENQSEQQEEQRRRGEAPARMPIMWRALPRRRWHVPG